MPQVKLQILTQEERQTIELRAYQTLTKNKISQLPVDVFGFDVDIRSMQFVVENGIFTAAECLDKWGKHGIVGYVPDTGKHIICYNEDDSSDVQRWAIATGIGYIKLKYLQAYEDVSYAPLIEISFSKSYGNTYANEFSGSLVCPDEVLRECGITEASDIIHYCDIPFNKAHIKSLELRRRLNKKIWDAVDASIVRALIISFREYICKISEIHHTIQHEERK